ncbi:TPA: hypothetical protein ACH3X2_006359 [Trebouxia sp. C0005]
MACKSLYARWSACLEETEDLRFLLWSLQWLADRPKDVFDACRSGSSAYFVRPRFLDGPNQDLTTDFFETDRSFIESIVVLSHTGYAFPKYDIKVFKVDSQAALWRKLESGQTVAGFGLVQYLRRPAIPYDDQDQVVAFAAQSGKEQLLRCLTGAPPVRCAVLHLMSVRNLTWSYLLQAAETCYTLLCSREWLRGQMILYLADSRSTKTHHIIIDLNPDGSWAVDDRRSRNRPVVVNFSHMPATVVEQQIGMRTANCLCTMRILILCSTELSLWQHNQQTADGTLRYVPSS